MRRRKSNLVVVELGLTPIRHVREKERADKIRLDWLKVRRTCANTVEQQADVRAKNLFQTRSREGHAPRTV
jgi:hypothetical protein